MIKIVFTKSINILLLIIFSFNFISCSEIEEKNKYILKKNIHPNIIFGVIDSLVPLKVSGIEFKINRYTSHNIKKYEIGQNVIINYINQSKTFEVTKMQTDNILLAPVSFIGENELIVLNQRVIITSNLFKEYQKIIPGHWVEISGLYVKEGKILATNIKLRSSQSFGYIKGKVSQLDRNFISIGKQMFKFRTPVASTVSGDIVKIVFTKEDDLYKTFKIENLSNKYINLINHNIIIDGFISQGDDKKYRVSGFPFIIYDTNRLYKGQRLAVKGKVLPGSIIDNK
ncbi:MAG: hypothetical protein CFH01_00151 [Alphaproteobacteria bacterium MarineAlpha2_Bin1]|nr:MAG: hypothetical protein CFH01_00151 [Alphaproteobacteria bacterium MarineAlpha2_Bin1]